MKKLLAALSALVLFAFTGIAIADYTIKDGNNASQTILAFVCATTKICPAHVVINSSGTELGTTSNPFQTGAPASAFADGSDMTLGAKADAACGTDTGTCSLIALQKRGNQNISGPIPAQTGIGNVNIGAVQSAGSNYETVAASQTAQAMGATGATGDYLSHCVIYPVTTGAGAVTVFDNTNAAGTNVITFTSGTLSNLAPIAIPVGAISTAGAWKVTTGANVTVTCYGKFT